ncbi:MAG TPA: PQQ-binding-like beta-propeller repeat protein, partial [Anaerolineae bacterium]|nr:PQQ-binding-like beta-propeller repeat protein [Anaerolineae bacterium]
MRAILRLHLLSLVLLGIALLTACKPTAQSATGDIHLGLIWPEQGSPLSPQLAIGPDGTMYVLDDKSTLHAVASNGQERWTYQSDAKYTGLPMMSSDGTAVYFLTSNNELISVGTNGQLRWTFKAADVFSGPPVIAPDGTVYLRIQSGGQRVSTDGKGQAFTWPKNTDRSQAAFDSKGQLAIYNPIGYQLLILAPDGTVSAHCEEKMSIRFGPLIDKKDVVVYTLNDGSLVARDTACTELWRSATGASQVQGADYPLALSADGTLYVSLPDGRIQLIDAESGKPLSTIEAGTAAGTLIYLTIAKDGTLYALNDQATLLAFRDGKQIWSQPSTESD